MSYVPWVVNLFPTFSNDRQFLLTFIVVSVTELVSRAVWSGRTYPRACRCMLFDFFGYRNMYWEDSIYFFPTPRTNLIKFQFQVAFGMTRFQNFGYRLLAHLAEGNVSFCHHLASVVVRRPSSVVRRPSSVVRRLSSVVRRP